MPVAAGVEGATEVNGKRRIAPVPAQATATELSATTALSGAAAIEVVANEALDLDAPESDTSSSPMKKPRRITPLLVAEPQQ